jgi:hypothetical protein
MAASILRGIFRIFANSTNTKTARAPEVFRSGRAAPCFPSQYTPAPPVVEESRQQLPPVSKWLFVEFGSSTESKQFKKVVQDALTASIEGCAALTSAHKKENGRAVIIHFRSEHYAPEVAKAAYDFFVGVLDVFAINAGSVHFDTSKVGSPVREWNGNRWHEILTPENSDGKIMGFVLGGRIGMQIL